MHGKKRRRLLSVSLVLLIALSTIPGGVTDAASHTDDAESYYDELAELVQETWSDDYLDTLEFRIDDPVMTVDGDDIEIDPGRDTAPYISENGDAMLPLRVLTEVLELEISFDEATSEISIEGDGVAVSLRRGDKNMRVNGRKRQISTAPVIKDGRTYVPARAVTESLLFDVEYIDYGKRVLLTKPYQTKRLIVRTDGAAPAELASLDGQVRTIECADNTYVIQFDSEFAAKESLDQLDSASVFCEPDIIMTADSGYRSWGVTRIGADKYQEYLASVSKLGVVVAVLDTGVDMSHPMLTGRVVAGRNLINNNNNPYDADGHGTHVAGTIAESTLSNVLIMPVKVLGDNGSGTMSIINAGITYAADHGAAVINMSLGGTGTSSSTRSAILYANSKNAVVVVAAGNQNENAANHTPANIAEAITVAACDKYDRRASFSNYGNIIDVSAPGVGINSSITGGRYATYDGTSMATPHVTASVALIKSDPRYAGLSPSELETALRGFTDDAGAAGFDIYFGYGIVNMTKALSGPAEPTQPSVQKPIITTQPKGVTVAAGSSATLTVAAASPDGGSLSYQWYIFTGQSWSALSGAASASYTLSHSTEGARQYCVMVANRKNGEKAYATSTIATVTVTKSETTQPAVQKPVITTQPKNVSVAAGSAATLTVAATSPDGGSLSYQWYISSDQGWSAISGANSSTYTVSHGTPGARDYCVMVANRRDGEKAYATSVIATVTVTKLEQTPPVSGGSYTLKVTVRGSGTVSVSASGGGSSSSSSSSGTINMTCRSGSAVAMTATPQSGYVFKGWEVVSSEISLSSPYSGAISFTMPSENVELLAVFGR